MLLSSFSHIFILLVKFSISIFPIYYLYLFKLVCTYRVNCDRKYTPWISSLHIHVCTYVYIPRSVHTHTPHNDIREIILRYVITPFDNWITYKNMQFSVDKLWYSRYQDRPLLNFVYTVKYPRVSGFNPMFLLWHTLLTLLLFFCTICA